MTSMKPVASKTEDAILTLLGTGIDDGEGGTLPPAATAEQIGAIIRGTIDRVRSHLHGLHKRGLVTKRTLKDGRTYWKLPDANHARWISDGGIHLGRVK
jgi:hypothetical protein